MGERKKKISASQGGGVAAARLPLPHLSPRARGTQNSVKGNAAKLRGGRCPKGVRTEVCTNLLELLDGTLVDATALVDQMAGL